MHPYQQTQHHLQLKQQQHQQQQQHINVAANIIDNYQIYKRYKPDANCSNFQYFNNQQHLNSPNDNGNKKFFTTVNYTRLNNIFYKRNFSNSEK